SCYGSATYVANWCLAASRATEYTDGENFFRTGVVGNLEPRFLLNHLLTPVVSLVLIPRLGRALRNGHGNSCCAYPQLGETYVSTTLSEATCHTVLLSRGRGTFMQDGVLTFRQMLGGWPGYEKVTVTISYLIMEVFKKSLSNIGLTRVYWCLKRCTRTGVPVRVQLYVIREVLFGAFHDIGQSPVLRLGQRTGLCQTNAVANTGAILFVMGFDAFGPTHDFAVQSVLFEVFDFDDNGLIHFVGDDYPAQGFTVVTLWSGCGVNRLSHCDSSSAYLRLFFLSLVSSW